MKKVISVIATVIFMVACKDAKEKPIAIEKEVTPVARYASYSAKPADTLYTKDDIAFLKKMGMGASYTVRNSPNSMTKDIADKYNKKFGVRFVSNEAVSLLMEEKDLIIGNLTDFNGVIPKKNIDEFKENLSRIKEIDASFNDYYFIRTTRDCNARFLQKISESEIQSGKENIVKSSFLAIGQSVGVSLFAKREMFYRLKYNISDRCDIIVGNYSPDIKIIAPMVLFNTEGKTLVGRQLVNVRRDPAIVLMVPEGYLVLTVWE